ASSSVLGCSSEQKQSGVSCSVCWELSTEPLRLGCGHGFCPACISDSREARGCPVCGRLPSIVEHPREVGMSPEDGWKEDLCRKHGKKLLLLCREDREVFCLCCEKTQEHRDHHLCLIRDAAKECQEMLQAALRRLQKEQQKAEELEADIREQRTSCKVGGERQRIRSEFNQLRCILDCEERRELQKLEEEERKTLDNLAAAEAELVQQTWLLKDLISDLECRREWPTQELLRRVNAFVLPRGEIWTLRKPKLVSKKLRRVFRAPDLGAMLQAQRGEEDITLDPFNLNLNLVLSEDQRQVISVPIWPVKCYNYGVLGSQYFSSGKHYWEVDVSKKTAWVLGVYCRARSCTAELALGRGAEHQNAHAIYRPQCGYWVIGLKNAFKYKAFEDASTCDLNVLTLSGAVPPLRVGVFLDCEAGTVSFFNVTNYGSLIYRFSKCSFSQNVYPYFNPWNCPAPMTLCPPSS
uniref:Tripartite motif containing 34 n=1 Tax=Sus scrofa TaxID=9823 RepID=A0A4X1SDL2_PIG